MPDWYGLRMKVMQRRGDAYLSLFSGGLPMVTYKVLDIQSTDRAAPLPPLYSIRLVVNRP